MKLPTLRRRHKLLVAGAAGLLSLGVGAGAAWGFWTTGGSGTGTATGASIGPVTLVAVTGSPSTPLYPGGTGDVVFNISNSNAYPVTLSSVTLEAGHSITASNGIGTCSGSGGVSFTTQTPNITIPANTATNGYPNGFPVDLAGAASMSTSSPTGCQGATFSVPITITVKK